MAGHVFHHSKRRLLAAVALCGVIGLIAAGVNVGAISLFPPKLTTGNLQVATGVAHVMVDAPQTSIVKRKVLPQDIDTLVRHTELMARVMISRPVTDRIARRAGVPPDQFGGVGRVTAFVPITLTEPGSEQRASEIEWSKRPYRLEVQARPTVTDHRHLHASADVGQAQRLADEAAAGLRDYLRAVADNQGVPEAGLAALRPARQGARRDRERRLRPRDRCPDLHGRLRPLAAAGLARAASLCAVASAPRAATTRPHVDVAPPARAARAARKPLARIRRRRLAAHDAAPAVDAGCVPRDALARSLQLDRAERVAADRHAPRPARAALPRRYVAAGAGGGRSCRAATQLDVDPYGARHLPGLRLPQRRARRALPEPHARVRPVAQEASAHRLLRVAVRDHCQRGAAKRGVRLPRLHARSSPPCSRWG